MPQQPQQPQQATPTSEECGMALMCHIVALVAASLLLNWLVPIIIWRVSSSPFVRDQAREVLNFHISLILWALLSWALCLVGIGFFMLIACAICGVIFPIIGAIKSSEGERYRYPLTWRLIK